MRPEMAPTASSRRTPRRFMYVGAAVLAAFLLSLVVVTATDGADAGGEAAAQRGPTPLEAEPGSQTSALNALWWRSQEEQDTFIHAFFGRSLVAANIGGAAGSASAPAAAAAPVRGDTQLPAPRPQDGAPAESTRQSVLFDRRAIPRLHMMYTMSREEARKSLAENAALATASPTEAETEATHRQHTLLEAAARTSPIASLRTRLVAGAGPGRGGRPPLSGTLAQSPATREAAPRPPLRARSVAATATAAGQPSASTSEKLIWWNFEESDDGEGDIDGDGTLPPRKGNYLDETVIDVSSMDRMLLPIQMVGSGTTVVQIHVSAGNTINTVVQLKDHRYDKDVERDNCQGMYLRVEVRNHYRIPTDAPHGTAQAHAYIDRDVWAGAAAAARVVDGSDANEDPDISSGDGASSWSNFWDSFAQLFDNSALCKVLPSVSMRVNQVPASEPFYVILRSTVAPYVAGRAQRNISESAYRCQLELFVEQEEAVRLGRLQLVFSFILPLLVLLLPLPFTMWRADLVQQYMMDSDFAEWVWMPPLLARKKMVEGLRAAMEWVVSLRAAYQQRVLRQQLLRQEQAHPPASPETVPTQPPPPPPPQGTGAQHFDWRTLATAALAAAPAAAEAREHAAPTAAQTPVRRQFREEETGASLSCSSSSASSNSSQPSTASDADEPQDGVEHPHHHRRRHRCHLRSGRECGGGCGGTAEDTGRRSFTTGHADSTHARRHRHTRGQRPRREAAAATVSVHVPPQAEEGDHTHQLATSDAGARGGHCDGHDLLFGVAEAARAARLPAGAADESLPASSRLPREDLETQAAAGEKSAGGPAPISAGGAVLCDATTSAGTGPVVSVAAEATTKRAAAAAAAEAEEPEEEPFCRICREGSDVAPLITPCACTGSVRFVHAACLDRWRIESAKRNLANVNHCEICKEPFRVNIQRATLVWESSQHILSAVCLFLTCFAMVVVTTTLTHVVLGEMSCLASYHQVAYSTMFRFEGLSLTFFVYCLAVLLVLFANLIVYSWFRDRADVAEYIEEMHIIPPFYTRRNVLLIVVVCVVLLAQVHASGYLLKYFLYHTSRLVWNWETSPLMGGVLFALFTSFSISFCSWGRHVYTNTIMDHGNARATDVVVEAGSGTESASPPPPPALGATPAAAGAAAATVEETHGRSALPLSPSQSVTVHGGDPSAPAVGQATAPAAVSAAQLSPAATSAALTSPDAAAAPPTGDDVHFNHPFAVPPEQRVIRAFEYCPPRRKLPKW